MEGVTRGTTTRTDRESLRVRTHRYTEVLSERLSLTMSFRRGRGSHEGEGRTRLLVLGSSQGNGLVKTGPRRRLNSDVKKVLGVFVEVVWSGNFYFQSRYSTGRYFETQCTPERNWRSQNH